MAHTTRSTVRVLKAAERHARALELRMQGLSFEEIARECGYRSRGAAYAAVQQALRRLVAGSVEESRQRELARLDRLVEALAPRLEAGDPTAVQAAVQALRLKGRWLGLDAPQKVETTARVEAAVTYEAEDAREALRAWLGRYWGVIAELDAAARLRAERVGAVKALARVDPARAAALLAAVDGELAEDEEERDTLRRAVAALVADPGCPWALRLLDPDRPGVGSGDHPTIAGVDPGDPSGIAGVEEDS